MTYEVAELPWLKGSAITAGILAVITLLVKIFASLGILESFRIVFGSVYVLFLPGFIISFIFFTETREFDSEQDSRAIDSKAINNRAIDWIERIALSFALSIAIVPLCVFYLNLAGVKINLLNSFLTILGIIIISSAILFWKIRRQ